MPKTDTYVLVCIHCLSPFFVEEIATHANDGPRCASCRLTIARVFWDGPYELDPTDIDPPVPV